MAITKDETLILFGGTVGLGLGILLCAKHIFGLGAAAPVNPFPPPSLPLGFYGLGDDARYLPSQPRGNYLLPP